MMDKFRQLAPREQIVLIVGSIVAVAVIGWSFVWIPLSNGASELSDEVAEREAQVVNLRRAAQLGAAASAARQTIDAPNLVILVDETARPLGLTFPRSNPDGPDAVNVSFRDARFDSLIEWTILLEQDYGLGVVSVSFAPGGGVGLVNGQLRLERS